MPDWVVFLLLIPAAFAAGTAMRWLARLTCKPSPGGRSRDDAMAVASFITPVEAEMWKMRLESQ